MSLWVTVPSVDLMDVQEFMIKIDCQVLSKVALKSFI